MDRRKSLKFPVCSLCSQSFALRGNQKPGCGPRSPLILKCGHTACEGCIVRGIAERRKVTCSCHEISSPSEKYLERNVRLEFPLDYYTIGVYSVLANIVATDVHQLARAFREHKTIPLRPTVPELGSSDAHCPIHRLQLEFFCNDCSKSICSRCLLNDHKGHNIDLLADKNKVAMDDLIDLHVTVVNHQKRLKATRKYSFLSPVGYNLLYNLSLLLSQHFPKPHLVLHNVV
ncbi:hypothetical protein AAG570_002161 [Ranatra chinensis]|uniref:B box-type domain-containing protein n=1 Tax=Ranatra chinensis TaxID=642074 RepID=A0ABD0YPI8_9HEMI